MNFTREQVAPWSFILGVVALVFSAGWYVVNRQLGLPGQIGLGLAVLAVTAGVLLDPDRIRQALTGRRARYGSNALLLILAFTGILAVTNYFALQSNQTWDLTEDRQFSLAPETQNLLASLDQPVQIIGFFTPDAAASRENIEPLLNRYQALSNGMLQLQFVDPRQQPLQADRYGVTRDGSLVVVQGDRSEVVSFANEREISSSIISVSSPTERLVYFVTGHGERDIDQTSEPGYSQVKSALESKSYQVQELNLLSTSEVPADADVVVVARPEQPLSEEEIQTLGSYLDGGGSVLILMEPVVDTAIDPADNPIITYLEQKWGVVVRNDVVVDLGSNLPLAGIAVSYASHPITDRMGNLASFFPSARSLGLLDDSDEGIVRSELVQTGQNSWGETNLESITGEGQLGMDEAEDYAGPLTLAVAARDDSTEARLVVFGDSDFATNSNFFGLGNGDLLVNSIDWLAGEEDLIQLTPKQTTQRTVVPPSVQAIGLIFLATVILIPGAAIGAGVAVWWRRRQMG